MVTPWLRATSSTSYAHGFIAESGGSGPRTTGRVERREDGAWVPVEGWNMMTAFAFAGDTRVVIGRLLVPQTGTPKQIECTDDLRAAPNELVCVVRLYDSVSTHFLGFGSRDDLFFSVYRDSAEKDHGPNARDACEAFDLSVDDRWTAAGKLPFTGRDFGACGDVDGWKTRAGLPLVTGTRPRPWW